MKPQGFIGRLVAQRLASRGFDSNPERWNIEQTLFAALELHDAPGAISIGERVADDGVGTKAGPHAHTSAKTRAADFDRLAVDVAAHLGTGSSAGGEQAKFLALEDEARHLLIKFTPPRGTPFGERWNDLLHAEALASKVLSRSGVGVADCEVVESSTRSYLASERFDRIGKRGRRHVVAVDAVHHAFVPGPRQHWGSTCEALARQRRLSAQEATQALALLHFGRLIGNTDMHFGNLGFMVSREGLSTGRFSLAPVYDMLPMRWRPDSAIGLFDYSAFEPDGIALGSPAVPIANRFWNELAEHPRVSRALREVAGTMTLRVR